MRTVLAAVALCAFWPPAFAQADSDAYFCAGSGYLAFERRLSTNPVAHHLHVVRFGTTGMVVAPLIPLDDFQVHAMICRRDTVELLGWNAAYSVDISDAGNGRVTSRAVPFDVTESKPPENLGHWAKDRILDLEVEGQSRFQLVISRVSQPVRGGIEHHTVSRLIQRGANAEKSGITASLTLFEGVFRETVN